MPQAGVYAGPSCVARAGLPERPNDLVRDEAVLLEVHTSFAPQVTVERGGRRTFGVPLTGRVVVAYLGTAHRLAAEHAGVAVPPAHLAKPDVEAGRCLALLPPGWPSPGLDAHGAVPARRPLPARTRVFPGAPRWFRWP